MCGGQKSTVTLKAWFNVAAHVEQLRHVLQRQIKSINLGRKLGILGKEFISYI